MKRIIVATPESGTYREAAMEHARACGDAPMPGAADAYAWLPVAHSLALYVDHGVTTEMADLAVCARAIGLPVTYRVTRPDDWAAQIYQTAFPPQPAAEASA